jgi:hypothetical protein
VNSLGVKTSSPRSQDTRNLTSIARNADSTETY